MNQAMEDFNYLTESNNTGHGDIDRDAMENAISSINNVPSVNTTKKDNVVKLMRKLSAIPDGSGEVICKYDDYFEGHKASY